MSAPRRPDKPGGRPASPSRGKPARPRKDGGAPAGERKPRPPREESAKAPKGPRVRKDGSIASGRAEDRRTRTEGSPAGTRPKRPDGARTERQPRPDRAPATAKAPHVRSEGGPADPRPKRPARGDSSQTERRPRRDRAAATAKAPRDRSEGGPADTRPKRPARRDDPQAERKPRPDRAPAAAKAPRVRKDGSVAVRAAPSEGHSRREPQRIAKLLARAGVASRREIERMIAEGRIALNGAVLDTPATILTTLAGVTVDGQPVAPPEAARLFLFHKPSGVLTAERDFSGRPTIYDRLPVDLPRLVPVGRLDLNTEGLLLLTNDGELKRKLELPSTAIPRIYRARAYGEVAQEDLEALSEGIEIDGIRYGSIDANMERRTGRNLWIEMKLTEGKNREVRRVLEFLGLQVSRLIRVAYGPFILADLPSGEVGEVKQHELVEFRKTLK